MGHVTTVMFSPEDLRMLRDGPAARRRFIDMQLSQIRPSYLKALRRYLNVLDSRNALLKAQKKAPMSDFMTQLETWDEQLASAAIYVVEPRRWFLQELAENAAAQYAGIAEEPDEIFQMRYIGPLAATDKPYRQMLAGLQKTREEDMQRLYTAYGPHRDDMEMTLCGKPLTAYGSQGQLRTAVLALKLGELKLILNEMGDEPALLLDDVFSELDVKRRAALLRGAEGVQTFLTCTDRQDAADAKADQFICVSQDEKGCAVLS
ncbi:MAG: DNA replication and repair protein RecF [Clostridia bacterium]|nr:DNA replication and repair protein RecF [Clostridia bacterium]